MRFLLASGVLFVIFVVTSALYNPVSFKPRNLVKLLDQRRNVIGNAHQRQKRQSQACINAYLEAQSTQFQECSQLFADGNNVTIDEVLEFCDNYNCVSLMTRVLIDLQSCEGTDDGNTTQEALKYLHLFCTKNSNGDYCLRLLDNIQNGVLQLPIDDITNCDFTVPTGRCSNACKNVATWVKTKLGCCYDTFKQTDQIPAEYNIPDDFFTKCNQQISAC